MNARTYSARPGAKAALLTFTCAVLASAALARGSVPLGVGQDVVDEASRSDLDAATVALDDGWPARALELLGRPTDPARALLAARAHYASGDLVGTTEAAARGLGEATDTQRRELLWWGSNAALGLKDAEAAAAWTDRLRASSNDDETWSPVADRFGRLAAELAETERSSTAAVDRARVLALVGLAALVALVALFVRPRR